MGLNLSIFAIPPGGDLSDDGLAALIDVHVLNNDLLLALAAMLGERFNLSGVRPREFCGLGQVGLSCFCRLIWQHRTPVAFHCRSVRSKELRRHHAL